MTLKDLLSDIISVENVLLIVKSNAATSEIRSNSLSIKQNEKWITIGDNDGPCHMHVNSELVKKAKFIEEEKIERTSFSVRFFDEMMSESLHVSLQKCMTKTKSFYQNEKSFMMI